MDVSWNDLQRWTPAGLEESYDLVLSAQQETEAAGDQLLSAKTNFSGQGQAALAFRGIVDRYRAHADGLEARLTELQIVLNQAAEAVEQLAIEVDSTQAAIDAVRYLVDAADRVQLPDWLIEQFAQAKKQRGTGSTLLDLEEGIALQRRDELQVAVDTLLEQAKSVLRELASGLLRVRDGEISDAAQVLADSNGSDAAPQEIIDAFGQASAAQVRAMWDSLDFNTQRTLRINFPEIIGNLSGIPLLVRQKANDSNMNAYLEREEAARSSEEIQTRINELTAKENEGNLGRKERAELADLRDEAQRRQAVRDMLDGDGAVVFDPSNNRVVAIEGDITSAPEHLITVVPGTGTWMGSFADGGVRDLPRDLVAGLQEFDRSAVAFVVKDGPWASWAGENSNMLHSAMERMGTTVANVDADLRVEDFNGDPKETAIAHSAGMSITSAAEVRGAHYDKVISIAGSYMVSDWEPDQTTEYTHIQYEADAINALDRSDWHTTPNESADFDKVILDSGGRDGVDGHTRIAQGKDRNPEGFKSILDKIVDGLE